MSTKRSYIPKQTCSFQLQVCLNMYGFLVDIRRQRVNIFNIIRFIPSFYSPPILRILVSTREINYLTFLERFKNRVIHYFLQIAVYPTMQGRYSSTNQKTNRMEKKLQLLMNNFTKNVSQGRNESFSFSFHIFL